MYSSETLTVVEEDPMKIHTTAGGRRKKSASTRASARRSSFELFLYALLCLGVAACGSDNTVGVDEDEDVDVDEDVTNPCLVATPISIGESVGGRLNASDCLQPDGAFGERWSLSLSDQTDVRIDLASSAFDAFLELQNDVGTVIAQNDDAGGSLDSRLVLTLRAGSYIILARSLFSRRAGDYQLTVSEAPDCSPVGSLELGQTVTGALADGDCLFEFGGNMDNWSLSLTSTQRLRFDLKSSDFTELLLVRDQDGFIVNGASGGGPIGHARLDTELSAGDWTISVTTDFGTALGTYELTVDVAPPCTPGTDLVLGETVTGDLSPSDCTDFGLPADSFGITLTEETAISIHLKSPDFEPFLILRDANGLDIAIGFDEMRDGNARIRQSLSAGSYALFAATFSFPPEGSYQLTVSEVVCDDSQAIDFGQTVTGTLDTDDCLRPGGAFQESWGLVLANDTTARIDLESVAFDAFLVLKDSDGNILATDDDGGTGLNSRIDRALTAGTYEIVASAFGTGQTGAYELTVDVPPPATAAVDTDRTTAPGPKPSPTSDNGTEKLRRLRMEYEARRVESLPGFLAGSAKDQPGSER